MTFLLSFSAVRLSYCDYIRIRDFLLLSYGRIGFIVCTASVSQDGVIVNSYNRLKYLCVRLSGMQRFGGYE